MIHSTFSEKFLNKIANKVGEIIESKFNERIKKQDLIINQMNDKIIELERKNAVMMKKLDDQEQIARMSNVRIFGFAVADDQNLKMSVIKLLNDKLKAGITDADIQRCYRVRAKSDSDKPPAVVVRFSNDVAKATVFKNRKYFKNTGFHVKEDLTKFRLSLLDILL